MAIARVQRKSTGTTTAATVTSRTTTYDSATTSGNYLICVVNANNAGSGTPTITPPSGWTAIITEQYNDSFILGAYYKVSDGSETSVTWSVSSSTNAWRIVMDISEYSGVSGIEKAQYGPANTSTVSGVSSLDWPSYKNSCFLHWFSFSAISVGSEPSFEVEYGSALSTWNWHRTSSGDTVYASLRGLEYIGSSGFQDWVDASMTSGTSANGSSGSLGFILTPTGGTATDALASGTGSATHVQSVANGATGTGTSLSLTFSAATSGNFLFAALRGPDPESNTVTPPTGWTMWGDNSTTTSFWYKYSTGGETTVTWTWTSAVGGRRLVGCEFSGVQSTFVSDITPPNAHIIHSASISSSPDQTPYGSTLNVGSTSGDTLQFVVVSASPTTITLVGDDGFTFRVASSVASAVNLFLLTKASLVAGIAGGRMHSTSNPDLMSAFSNFQMAVQAQPPGNAGWGWHGQRPYWQVIDGW